MDLQFWFTDLIKWYNMYYFKFNVLVYDKRWKQLFTELKLQMKY